MNKTTKYLIHLLLFIAVILLSLWIFRSPLVRELFLKTASLRVFGEFISGAFYTSFLTVPLSIAMFSVVAQTSSSSVVQIALIGSIGAMLADYLIDKVYIDLFDGFMLWEKDHHTKWAAWFEKSALRRKIAPIVGFIVWVSPLPDDFALMLIGTSKMKPRNFFLLSFIANFIGIFLLVQTFRLVYSFSPNGS